MGNSLRTAARIAVISGLAGLLGFAASYLMPKGYSSYQTLYFPLAQQSGAASAVASALKGSSDSGDSSGVSSLKGLLTTPVVASGPQTAIGILTSNTCYRDVIKRLKLKELWKVDDVKALKTVSDAVNVRTDKNNFLRIEATAGSPKLAKNMVEALYTHLESRAQDLTFNLSAKNRKIIEQSLKDVETRTQLAQDGLVASLSRSGVTTLDTVEKAYGEARARLDQAQLDEVKAEVQLRQIELNLRASLGGTPGLDALEAVSNSGVENGSKALSDLASQLVERRTALADATKRFQSDTPEYRDAQNAASNAEKAVADYMASQKENLAKGISPQLIRAKAELSALKQVSKSNQRLLDSYGRSLQSVPSTEDARRRYEGLLELRKYLGSELEIAKIAEMRDPSRFEIVDPPVENEEAVSPRRTLIAGALFLLALGIQIIPLASRKVKFE
jgi:hypothetical protein